VRFTEYYQGDRVTDNMGGACSTHEGDEKCVQRFGEKREGKRQLGRPRRRWKDNSRLSKQAPGTTQLPGSFPGVQAARV